MYEALGAQQGVRQGICSKEPALSWQYMQKKTYH